MSTTYSGYVKDQLDDYGLSGHARQRAEEALTGDAGEAARALYDAAYLADDEIYRRRSPSHDEEPDDDLFATLKDTRRANYDALDELTERIIRETVTGVNVGSHTVNLRHSKRLNPCPSCDEPTESYFLGHADGHVGWVCGHCRATVETDRSGNVLGFSAEDDR